MILGDQLYRARLLGCFGLAVSFASLAALADDQGQLGESDSGTLRRLVELAEREPLQLLLPEPCAALAVIGQPQPLSAWLPPRLAPGTVASIEYDLPNGVEPDPQGGDAGGALSLVPPPIEAFVEAPAAAAPEPATPAVSDPDSSAAPATGLELALADAAAAALEEDLAAGATLAEDVNASAGDAVLGVEDESAEAMEATEAPSVPDAAPPHPGATDPQHAQRCLAWAAQLQGMSGPKVHGSVEKAFITAYLPLCRELASGTSPAEARAAADRWAEGFAQSYASAFRQLHTRTRRPRMVRDVVDLGFRWLGQHSARQCQLLLVSAMRFNLGQRLNEELERRLAGAAACVEQGVLWAALPSNAEAQQLVSPDALRARRGPNDPAPRPPAADSTIQPFFVGNRELFRLGLVLQDLPNAAEVESVRLGRLAVQLADSIVPWMQRQPPDTLIVLFGDHGFHWQSSPRGTSAAQRGGALPEQVLVPASAWLHQGPRQAVRLAPGVH